MIIGVPKEIKDNEKRVSITPYGVAELVSSGNEVYVEKNAGIGSGFLDKHYLEAGASILESTEDIFEKSILIVKVKEPQENEISLIKDHHIIFTFCSKLWFSVVN